MTELVTTPDLPTGTAAFARSWPAQRAARSAQADQAAAADSRAQADRLVEAAYSSFAGPLFRRLVSLTHDHAAAEDLTQESFVRLAVEVRAGRAPDCTGAWLHRVGANLATTRGRRASVAERRLAELPRPGVAPSPEVASIDAEQARAVRSALATLGRADQAAVLLAAQGYRGPEIASRLGRSEGATRTLLCRARSKLRRELIAAGVSR